MINSHFLIDSHIAGYKIQNLYLDWQLNAINHLKSRHNRNWIGLLFMFCTWWWGCLIGILVTKTSTRSLEFTLRYHLLPWCQLGAEPFIFHRYLTNTAVKKLKKENAQGLGVYNRMNRVVAEPEKIIHFLVPSDLLSAVIGYIVYMWAHTDGCVGLHSMNISIMSYSHYVLTILKAWQLGMLFWYACVKRAYNQ